MKPHQLRNLELLEILRICEPSTDLERALFEKIDSELPDLVDDFTELSQLEDKVSDLEDDLARSQHECEVAERQRDDLKEQVRDIQDAWKRCNAMTGPTSPPAVATLKEAINRNKP